MFAHSCRVWIILYFWCALWIGVCDACRWPASFENKVTVGEVPLEQVREMDGQTWNKILLCIHIASLLFSLPSDPARLIFIPTI